MAGNYLQTIRGFSRDIRLYLMLNMTIGFAFFGIYAVVFNLYLIRLEFGPEFIGVVNGTYFILFGICCVPAGWLGRRVGSRRMMLAGTLAAAIAFVFIPLTETVRQEMRGAWVLGGYSLIGIAAWVIVVNGSPFLMSVTGKEERSHAFSMQTAMIRLSGFAGNLIGGVLPVAFAVLLGVTLDEPAPFRYPLLIPPVLFVVAFLLLLGTRKPEPGNEQRVARSEGGGKAPWRVIVVFSTAYPLWMAGGWSARTFFNIYMDQSLRVLAATIGTVMAAGQLMAVPGALLMPVLAKRYGSFRTVLFALLALAASQVVLAMLPYPFAAALAFVATYAAFGMAAPAFLLYCQEAVAPRWRSVLSGFTAMSWSMGAAALLFGGGYIATSFGYRTLFLTGGAMTTLGMLVFFGYFRTPRGEYAGSNT